MAEEKKNPIKEISDKVTGAFTDLVEKLFGEKGKEFVNETKDKMEELSSSGVKKLLDFSDKVLETLNVQDNETVQKARQSLEDGLKDMGVIKDEPSEDEF